MVVIGEIVVVVMIVVTYSKMFCQDTARVDVRIATVMIAPRDGHINTLLLPSVVMGIGKS